MKKVYFDVEATSVNRASASIFQIGAIVVNEEGNIEKAYSRFVKPYELISGGAIAVTGVSNQEAGLLSQGMTLDEFYDEMEEVLFSEPCELVCHNIEFDFTLLKNNLAHYKLPMYENIVSKFCTMNTFSKIVTGNGKRAKLSRLYEHAAEIAVCSTDELEEMFNDEVIPKVVGKVRGANFHDALWDSFCCFFIDLIFRG